MKTPMQELIEWLKIKYEESLNQKNQPKEWQRFYDGQSDAFEMAIYTARKYIVKEEEVITDSYVAGEKAALTDYGSERKAYTKRSAYKHYDETFNNKQTPKDKAEYLLNKYGEEDALFCIKHLIELGNESGLREPMMYWQKVKQEIENL